MNLKNESFLCFWAGKVVPFPAQNGKVTCVLGGGGGKGNIFLDHRSAIFFYLGTHFFGSC